MYMLIAILIALLFVAGWWLMHPLLHYVFYDHDRDDYTEAIAAPFCEHCDDWGWTTQWCPSATNPVIEPCAACGNPFHKPRPEVL